MTPERLIIKVMSDLHKEGITPNLENIESEQAHHAAERLLKLLGGLTDPEPRPIESGQHHHRPKHHATIHHAPHRDGRRVDSETQMLPVVQPAYRSLEHPTQTVQQSVPRKPATPRYQWGKGSPDASAAHPA